MVRRSRPHYNLLENIIIVIRSIRWKLLLLLALLAVLTIPTYAYGTRIGGHILPSLTNFFSSALVAPSPTATPYPLFPALLPQAGSLLYPVQSGDSCDEILAFQMRMAQAGQIFSDVNPNTVKALDSATGHNCHALQPGIVLALSPQYPLAAFGGIVLKIDATSSLEVVPTPLINVSHQQQPTADCSGGCLLTVRIGPDVTIRLVVETTLSVRPGSWVWAQATMPRKNVSGFGDYPYADPNASLDGATLHACDFQVDNVHDDNSLSCDQLTPNSINDDGGAWLFGVTGSGSLDHWHYSLHLPPNTRVLLWLSNDNGTLKFESGNPLYRYDEAAHVYVKV
ncbi:MAG: hypothetical protein JO125_11480 [Chloroflexi bacterium]|nr:hypothetical protein [Ktedonobacteraceae bacterium]MBV8821324.1 hypothetical protein [Ktedonobacteraceae bacterium]MBV9020350.1 hypothetical protein [Ktedonobacteraceae bacterium]MBV9708014.1 hypothetical protein [Chloroflexota bacterium]